ncbi:MAG TPA: aminotransferase class V-fold PLP-dependent enzyme [Vicinamibacteria bacterium]
MVKPMMEAVSGGRRDFARRLLLGGSALGAYAGLLARPGLAATRPLPLPEASGGGDERFWTAVKGQFVFPADVAVMNAANLCPAPFAVLEATANQADLDHDLSPRNRERMTAGKETTRALLAEVLRVAPEDVLITRNTSESNNLVSSGLDLKAGDEVVLHADNHPSNLAAWQQKAKRFGFTVKTVPMVNPHPGAEQLVRAFAATLGPRSKVLSFTHISSTVGDVFPARELCRLARERGVLSVVDGAQSFGLLDVDLSDMQPDFYSGSGHKWPCGPKETGVLYVSKAAQGRFWPSIISAYPGATGLSATCEALGQRDEPAIAGFAEALRFQGRIGRPLIARRAQEMAQALMESLGKMKGVRLWTHPDPQRSHAVVSFDVGGLDPAKLQASLYEKDAVVCATRPGKDRPGIRLSPHLYNTHAEVERALAGIGRLLAQGV